MTQFKLSEIQANHILDMPLRRLTRLARAGARGGAQGAARHDQAPEGAAEGPEEAPRRGQGGAARDPQEVRRPSPDRSSDGRRGRAGRRGPDRRGGRRHHGHPRRLRQAPARSRRSAARAGAARASAGPNLKEDDVISARVHHDHAPLAAVLHRPGARSTGSRCTRCPRPSPDGARPVRGEPSRRRDQAATSTSPP